MSDIIHPQIQYGGEQSNMAYCGISDRMKRLRKTRPPRTLRIPKGRRLAGMAARVYRRKSKMAVWKSKMAAFNMFVLVHDTPIWPLH